MVFCIVFLNTGSLHAFDNFYVHSDEVVCKMPGHMYSGTSMPVHPNQSNWLFLLVDFLLFQKKQCRAMGKKRKYRFHKVPAN